MIVLSIENIVKEFKGLNVLKGVSFKVKQGEIFGLVGLNGIGKTTLIKIILDLLRQDSGEIKLFGKINSNLDSKLMVAYLPEKFNPSPYLKGYEFLKLSLGYYNLKYSHAEANQLCMELDFDPLILRNRISSYSKGMGQKLGLISVFLTKVPLLILDEPMSGLDPSARIALKNKLISYKNEGKSVFFSSHILADIEEICDTIGVINNGNLIYEGNSQKFMENFPAKNLEESFLKAIRV
jgi:ABC-2 type transport system ATP-binding protein